MNLKFDAVFQLLQEDLLADGPLDRGTAPEATPRDVARYALFRSFSKKFEDDFDQASADAAASEKFLHANLRCASWRMTIDSSWEELLIGEFRNSLYEFCYPRGEPLFHSYADILNVGRVGPGASLGANGEDFYTKIFASKLSVTSSWLYDMYNSWCGDDPRWTEAEISRILHHGNYALRNCSQVTYVRKNADVSRVICTEPSLNMFYQLGLAEILRERLRQYFGIDLSVQPANNQSLARTGSITGHVATLDLESASDSISLGMAGLHLPGYLFGTLMDLRTPNTKIDGREVPLHMVSTMGNGFTFPLQTMLFAAMVRAVYRSFDVPFTKADSTEPTWGVFGDDIILPTYMVGRMVKLLTILGFRVNDSKSFFEGPFRESCGGDFHTGVNVRGVYAKTLKTAQSRYVVINLLNEWSARTGIYLPRTVRALAASVEGLAVPPHAPPDSGIRVPESMIRGQFYQSKRQRYVYRCYMPVRTVLRVGEDGNVHRPRYSSGYIRARSSNPIGLQIAFVGGYIRNMLVNLPLKQGERPKYRMRRQISPHWGPGSDQLCLHDWEFWMRWNSATEFNLKG